MIALKLKVLFYCCLSVFCFISFKVSAQDNKQIVQLSGIIVGEDDPDGLPGVHAYVPEARRGAVTNMYGYFSMPVLAGDSVIFSSLGYIKKYLIVPDDQGDSFTIFLELSRDTLELALIEVFPYPSESAFKESILNLTLPNSQDYTNMERNLNAALLAQMLRETPMDGELNYRSYMKDQIYYLSNNAGPRPNPLLNPFAWAEFIKSIKQGAFKRKK